MMDPQDTLHHALWRDAGLGLAHLDRDGIVVSANAYLEARAGRKLTGVPFIACVAQEQQLAFHGALTDLEDGWRSLALGLFPDPQDVPRDHRVSLRGEGPRVLVVAVPGAAGEEELLERLLRVNAELMRARRAARTGAHGESAARVIRRCRSVSDPALGPLPAPDLVRAVLQRLVEELDATGAVVLERRVRDGAAALTTAFAHGTGLAPAAPPAPESLAGRLALPSSPHVVRDPLSIRLLSPSLAATRPRSVALVPLAHDGRWIGALHVGGRTLEAFGAADAVLWAAAARVAPAVAATAGAGAHGGRPAGLPPRAPADDPPATAVVLDRPSSRHVAREVLERLPGVAPSPARIAAQLVEALLAAPPFRPRLDADAITILVQPARDGVRVKLESAGEEHLPGEPLNRVRGTARAWGFERDGGTRLWFEV